MINLFGYDFSISELVAMSLSFLLTVFYAFKTGGIKKLIKEVNETMVKFRSQQTVEPTVGQSISSTKPEYRLNKATDTLEETGNTIDIQAIIDSCKDQVLSAVLDRFLPIAEERENLIADYSMIRDDLDDMAKTFSKAEEYRKAFNLSDSLSVSDVFKFVGDKSQELKSKIEKLKQPVNTETEVKDNEEVKVDEKSE